MSYDVIIRDGLWFDGTGSTPQTRTLGIRDGVVCTVSSTPLDETGCPEIIDAVHRLDDISVAELTALLGAVSPSVQRPRTRGRL